MKNSSQNLLVAVAFIFTTLSTLAQNTPVDGLLLKGYGSYVFDDRFDARFDFGQYYDGKIKGGFQWGAGVEYRLYPETGIELMYLRQQTNAPTDYLIDVEPVFTDFDLNINYIMLGGLRYADIGGGNIEAFGGAAAGVMFADATNPDSQRSGSVTKFAWGIRGGMTIWGSERVGVMLQAQLLSAVQSMGGGLYFGTGGGGVGLSSYSTLFQFGLGGGLVFKMQ